jgi:hypothetical protein
MANEITVTSGLQIIKGSLSQSANTSSFQANLTGVRVNRTTQAVATTHEAFAAGDLATAGVARFTNLDTTNYVEIGVDVGGTFYPLMKILAGETWQTRLSILTFYLRANTAAVNVDCMVSEA